MQEKIMCLCNAFVFLCLMMIFLLSGCGGAVENGPNDSQANTPPIAVAGVDQTVTPGTIVDLDGGNSSDVDGDLLSYQWSLSSVPAGSSVILTGENTSNPSFVADQAGDYQIELVVNDGMVDSAVDTVRINVATYINDYGMSFNFVSAGSFVMGSPSTEIGRYVDEKQFDVVLTQNYYLMTTEVTQGQWQAVMGAGNNPSIFNSCGDDCPVENVSWNDVQDFIDELNTLTVETYRLPTEAEWEYAARAGSVMATYGGDLASSGSYSLCENDTALNDIAWYCTNEGLKTQAVGQQRANPWGLYDLLGNVQEWTQDWYGVYPDTLQSDPIGPASGTLRVSRGGSWGSLPAQARAAYRWRYVDGDKFSDLGFRLVWSGS